MPSAISSSSPSITIAIASQAAQKTTATMWPSTMFVELFNGITQVFHLLYASIAQVLHLLFVALNATWTILCIIFVLYMAALPVFGTGVAARETIALLYSLPRPKDEDERMKNWFTWAAPGNVLFGIALAGLSWNHPEASWKRLLFEADCAVLEAGFVVVTVAALAKGILVLVKASREKGFAVAMAEAPENLRKKLKELRLLMRIQEINSESIAESGRSAIEGVRKTDGSSPC